MHAECSTVGMCAYMQNVQQLACVQHVDRGMWNLDFELGDYENVDCHMWVSTGRDWTPEFRNLKAFRTVVSLFVDLVKFCTFSVNFEEGP